MKIISGMHRSGSSLVAQLFFEADADFGNPDTFYDADKWNPNGYFEQNEILNINMSLINGIWGKAAYLFPPSTSTILKRAQRYSGSIRKINEKYDKKIIKENRFCLTLPAWQAYDANIYKILICFRDPIQVASSLQKRNKIPLWLGYSLWQRHYQLLLKFTQNIPKKFIYYKNLLDSSTCFNEVSTAFHFFDIELSNEKLMEICHKTIKQDMNHGPIEETIYPENIASSWNSLLKMHSEQTNSYPPCDTI